VRSSWSSKGMRSLVSPPTLLDRHATHGEEDALRYVDVGMSARGAGTEEMDGGGLACCGRDIGYATSELGSACPCVPGASRGLPSTSWGDDPCGEESSEGSGGVGVTFGEPLSSSTP
jgi:hypothetical protein